MSAILGTGVAIFFWLTLVVMGFAAFMTGQALANTWRPAWQAVVYAALLGVADRFLSYALFKGHLLSLAAYALDTATLTVIALFAYRVTKARKMVSQYPWLYDRAGLFAWKAKSGDPS